MLGTKLTYSAKNCYWNLLPCFHATKSYSTLKFFVEKVLIYENVICSLIQLGTNNNQLENENEILSFKDQNEAKVTCIFSRK